MNQSFFERRWSNRLGRPPPSTVQTKLRGRRVSGRKNRKRGSAPARQEGFPPAFAIASPRSSEGEAMAKAGGKEMEF